MAFKTNDCQQLSFDDSFIALTERERKALEKSWAKIFADEIFPAIDEGRFSVVYSDKASRPNTPVNVIIGALIIKELFDYSEELLSMKNSQLHLTDEKPYAVIIGKGNKIRTFYLLPKTVAHLKRYLAEFHGETPDPEAYVFYSRNTGCHGKLTQPTISKMLRKYAKTAHRPAVMCRWGFMRTSFAIRRPHTGWRTG